MSTTKHTPGPWRYEKATGTVRDARNHCLFSARTFAAGGSYDAANNEAAEANLRLIAAAPAMFDLLTEADDLIPRIDESDPMGPALRDWLRQARAILNRATT